VVFAFALVVLNGLVLRLRSSLGLTRADLLVIYVILTLAAALIILLTWLNALFPAIPGPNLHYAIGQSIGAHGLPWNQLWDMVINLSPATIGVMCLVPGEISFSVWAFYLIFRTYQVVCASFGLVAGASGPGGFDPRSFFDYAGYGGFIVISAIVVYRARDAIGVGLRRLLGRLPKSADMDRQAPMTDAAAVVGFVLSNAVML